MQSCKPPEKQLLGPPPPSYFFVFFLSEGGMSRFGPSRLGWHGFYRLDRTQRTRPRPGCISRLLPQSVRKLGLESSSLLRFSRNWGPNQAIESVEAANTTHGTALQGWASKIGKKDVESVWIVQSSILPHRRVERRMLDCGPAPPSQAMSCELYLRPLHVKCMSLHTC